MLDFKDTDLARRELSAARALTEKQLANFDRQRKLYVGAFWNSQQGLPQVDDDGLDSESTDGTRFEFVALMMARMAFRVPSVSITSRRTGPQEQIAVAMKHACNRIIADSNYRQCQTESALDFLHQDAVLHLSLAETELYGGDENELNPMWPEANRISPRMFFQDPAALGPTLVRFMGHDTYIDKEDLIETCEQENEEEDEEGRKWDLEAVASIPEGEGYDGDGKIDVPDRKQVVLTTVWVRGYEGSDFPDDGDHHGTVFYYGSSTDEDDEAMLLLKQEPFYGPPWGPYYVGSAYLVPDSPYGLSPVTAAEGQLRESAKHAKAVGDSAEAYKKITLVDDPENTLGQRIASSPHLHVHNVAGLERSRVVDTVIGGADQQSVGYLQLTRDRVDRMLGISEAMRGVAAGDATATESALAGQAGDMRIAWIQAQFMELHERLFKGFTWYLWKTEEARVPLGPEALEELGVPPGVEVQYEGGETVGMDWADLELKINLKSTEHESEQGKLAKVQAGGQMLLMAAQAAPAAPWINWEEYVKQQGEALGLVKLHELWDQEMFEAWVARQMQMEMKHEQAPAGDRLLSSHPGPRSEPPQSNVKPLEAPTPQMGAGGMPGQQAGAQAASQASTMGAF